MPKENDSIILAGVGLLVLVVLILVSGFVNSVNAFLVGMGLPAAAVGRFTSMLFWSILLFGGAVGVTRINW